ncbi:MAG: GldG family protein [Desulfobacula sp.]|uniref:GldG family protein n=1 Tax=Desulfobacula sp. TaxID=2593537 RepID=UPI0025B94C0F|nr:GldG family protein [Desulfobacula sp.]MCD4722746.1 GldG family protein [Desulfobacula sp.]
MGNFSIKEKYFKFILYLVVIVLVNIVGITLFFRADLTRDKIYSLSWASQDVVATLSEPLSIKVFFSKNLPAPHNNTERYLKDLLGEYSAKGGKYFNYTFYNVTIEEGTLTGKADENRDMAKDYGIQPVQIRIMENDEIKFKNAYMGLVIIHGDLIEKIQTITSTNGLEYQLTTAIQKLNNKVSALLQLDEKVKIDMYLSSSLNDIAPLIGLDQLPLLGKAVADTVEKLNSKSLGILEFKIIDISDKKKLDTIGEKHDLMALSWPGIPERNILPGSGAAGLVIGFKGKTTTLPLINVLELPIIGTTYQMADPVALGEELNAIVEKLIGINKAIGFLSDHGTHSLMPDRMAMMQGRPSSAMQAFNSLVSSRYSIKQIALKDGSIPDGLNCLIIARPTQKFSDYELFQIDQALMKGTNIAFISDSFNEIMPQQGGMGIPPRYEPIDTGLENLLTHYGVNIKKAYVLDKQSYKHQAPKNMGGGEQNIYFAPMLKEKTINNTPQFMDNIKGLIAMQISPLELVNDNIDKNKIVVTKLLSSSDESWLMEGNINLNPMFSTPPESKDEMKSYDLAYLLEGSFTSFFKGKAIPEKELGEKDIKEENKPEEAKNPEEKNKLEGLAAKHTFLENSKPAKLFVLPCSQMLQDNMLDPQGRSTNATFILNIIDHLNEEDRIAQLRSKQQTLNPIAQTSPFDRGIIKAFNIIILPILVILFGLLVLARRTSRKKKIARRFNA